MVRALDLRLEIAGAIPAVSLSSATLRKSFTHICLYDQSKRRPYPTISIIRGSKQAHLAIDLSRVHGAAAADGVWLRAKESDITELDMGPLCRP